MVNIIHIKIFRNCERSGHTICGVGYCSTCMLGNTSVQVSTLQYMVYELLLYGILVVLLFSAQGVRNCER
jgi:hypothetical protein